MSGINLETLTTVCFIVFARLAVEFIFDVAFASRHFLFKTGERQREKYVEYLFSFIFLTLGRKQER